MGNVFGTSEDREDGPTDPCVYPACGHCRDLTDLEHPPTPPEEEDQTTANNNNNNNAGNKGNGKGQNNQNNGKGKNQQNKKGNNKNANRKGSNNNSNFNCNQGNSGGCEVGEVVEVQTDGQCAGDNGDESDDNSGPGNEERPPNHNQKEAGENGKANQDAKGSQGSNENKGSKGKGGSNKSSPCKLMALMQEVEDKTRDTPLHSAVCNNFALKYLLESGEYDVNARGAKSRSPLQWATLKGASVSARYLLMHGADPDIPLEEDDDKHNLKKGMTAVHIAARFGRDKILKSLCKWGADLEAQDRLGNTPLHHAVIRTGVSEVLKMLVESGASLVAKNLKQKTALGVAVIMGNNDALVYLSERSDPVGTKLIHDPEEYDDYRMRQMLPPV